MMNVGLGPQMTTPKQSLIVQQRSKYCEDLLIKLHSFAHLLFPRNNETSFRNGERNVEELVLLKPVVLFGHFAMLRAYVNVMYRLIYSAKTCSIRPVQPLKIYCDSTAAVLG